VVSAEQVSFMHQPTPAATIFSDTPWTLDQLDGLVPQTITRGLKNQFPAKK
jgi:hypothetical protein